MRRCINSLCSVLLLCLAFSPLVAQTSPDTVRILSVSPEGPVTRGVSTEIRVQVEAILHSLDEGVARVGFNSDAANGWNMIAPQDIHQGRQRLTFVVRTVPVDWGDKGRFAVRVSIGARADARIAWKPLTSAVQSIPVKP